MPASQSRRVVQFTHPGAEYVPLKRRADPNVTWSDDTRQTGIRGWNHLKSHKRKFMEAEGTVVLPNGTVKTDEKFTFWGEWEAHSTFRLTGKTAKLEPKLIHKPFFDPEYNGAGGHNTDPYVFGEAFWFTNCKQGSNNFLRNLSEGSLIIFGTEVADGFLLDTVFVVGGYIRTPIYDDVIEAASEPLKATNFLHGDIAHRPNGALTFYRGAMHPDPRMFCFTPCKVFEDGKPVIHERLKIDDWRSFQLQKPGARTVCTSLMQDRFVEGELPLNDVEQYWQKLVDLCFANDFNLAVKIEEPETVSANSVLNPNRAGRC
jgi:hypothetical protein